MTDRFQHRPTLHVLPLCILVAEDNYANQLLTQTLLNRMGHKVLIANNGREAVTQSNIHKFDMILMDIQMPQLNGIEATHHIRKTQGPNQYTPIIAMTAFASPSDKATYIKAGMSSTLPKPFRTHDMMRLIETLQNGALTQFIPSSKPISSDDNEMIDKNILSLLYQAIGPAPIQTVIASFWKDVDHILKNMSQILSAAQGNIFSCETEMRAQAHALKGAAANYGATQIYKLCNQFKKISQKEYGQLIQNLKTVSQKTKIQMYEWLAETLPTEYENYA